MDYKINGQNGIYVVSISGNITRTDIEKIIECKTNLLSSSPVYAVILNFKNLSLFESIAFREMTLLQFELRKLQSKVIIVGLNLHFKTFLVEKGVVRANEFSSNLADALKQLSNDSKV